MTKTIKQVGEAFNPHGVQFWANDETAVRKVLRAEVIYTALGGEVRYRVVSVEPVKK